MSITPRVEKIRQNYINTKPSISYERARIWTKSFQHTEGLPMAIRTAQAFYDTCNELCVNIFEGELIVGASGEFRKCGILTPEFAWKWVDDEMDNFPQRPQDPYEMTEEQRKFVRENIFPYWKGKSVEDAFLARTSEETKKIGVDTGFLDTDSKWRNGIGEISPDYIDQLFPKGFSGIKKEAQEHIAQLNEAIAEEKDKITFYRSIILVCDGIIRLANRYAEKAVEMAQEEKDTIRKLELLEIAEVCEKVPENPPTSFREALQFVWFVQLGGILSENPLALNPGRFDQYMYPYYQKDIEEGKITREFAQELIDCIWVKLNDLNKARDAASAEGFAGYSLFQNLIVGGQNEEGLDVTNDLSFMCIEASMHVALPQPSLSVRVWNGTPNELLLKAAELTRTGIGLPAYYNDEVIIPALMNRGVSLKDARDYNIIGCVEPQKAGKTEGWHDAAFFNMCRVLELVFSNGYDKGEQISIKTGDVTQMKTFEEFYDAYKKQMEYMISLLVNSDNAIDIAHAQRCPLPYESSMVDDCIKRGISCQEGGAVYNFTGPQGFGIANVADSLAVIRELVFEKKKVSMAEMKQALMDNFGRGISAEEAQKVTKEVVKNLISHGAHVTEEQIAQIFVTALNGTVTEEQKKRYDEILEMIEDVPKYGNDILEVDLFARDVAYTYTKPLEKYKNPRGGMFQAGLYPVSANVPLGKQTGATPDGRLAYTPVADGVGPMAGRDTHGPTATANSVARLDHGIASNGTLFNQKFHPSALKGRSGLLDFTSLIRAFFDQKGMHMQFNVVSRETLLDAQEHPEKYKTLVVRVAGYSALFTTLSKALQDDIINRTEQNGL